MTSLLRVASFQMLDEAVEEKDNCIVPQHMWRRWVQAQDADQEVLLLQVTQGEVNHILYVEAPHTQNTNTMYIPARCLQEFDETDYVRVRVMKTMPPHATKIVLQPLDSELLETGMDIVAEVSAMLSNWHTLTKHTMLSVPIQELGGLVIDLFVKEIEPADTVLLRGEVPLELEDALIQRWPQQPQIQPFQRPPTPIPQEPEQLEAEDGSFSMLPTTNIPSIPARGFQAFQGQGQRLGR
jgi:hypothetical protein